tara:strand:+ start:150 stop:323 length:174 start_codon:yes stop_codon:yes gene_type:complete
LEIFFFGFIAFIGVAGLPDKRSRKYLRQIAENYPKYESNKNLYILIIKKMKLIDLEN